MKYLLDSDTVSELFNTKSPHFERLQTKLRSLNEKDSIYISILTLYELEYGYENAKELVKSLIRIKITNIKEHCLTLPLSEKGDRHFAELKKRFVDSRKLKKEAAKKHNIDLMLASSALIEDCILVSPDSIYSDLAQYNSFLKVQNWLSPS